MKSLKIIIDVILPWRRVSGEDCAVGTDDAKKEPFIKMPLQAYKARRNMLLCGVLCAAQGYGAVTTGNPKIAGMDIGLPINILNSCLLIISIYFGAYFSALAWEVGDKWRLRRTGVPDSILEGTQGGFGGVGYSAKNVPQSTVWETFKERIRTLDSSIESINKKINDLDESNARQLTAALKSFPQNIESSFDEIKAPLEKFEKNFWDSQSKRWNIFLFFEFHGPIFLCFLCWLWLLVRIIFDLFLRCPAVQ